VNAYLIWNDRGSEMDSEWLERLAGMEGVEDALVKLREFAQRQRSLKEVEEWALVER
jgi:hypothetical protein